MKFSINRSQEEGSALLIVMMISGILIAALGTYLSLASNENQTVIRSLGWNSSLPLAEAGVEEALSHLNANLYNYATDGWTQSGTNYSKSRPMGNDRYSVNLAGSPGSLVTITSTGSFQWLDGSYITRDVQVVVRTVASYNFPGIVARVLALGGNFGADSYDSSDPLYSTGGAYDPAKASDKAFIASTGSGFTLSGSSHILGSVASGAGGTVSAKGAAIVGDATYNTKASVQPGHSTNGFTMDIPDVSVPFTSASAPASGIVDGVNYSYVLEGGRYMTDSLDAGKAGATMIVQSDTVLYVTGNVNLSKIVFENGAKLQLYLGGSSINFSPTLVGATSPQFSIFGLPSCTSMTLTGGTAFTGLIYAPQCDLKAAGNSSISGAIIGKTFTCTGTFDFHYDLAAGKNAFITPVTILTWNEI